MEGSFVRAGDGEDRIHAAGRHVVFFDHLVAGVVRPVESAGPGGALTFGIHGYQGEGVLGRQGQGEAIAILDLELSLELLQEGMARLELAIEQLVGQS